MLLPFSICICSAVSAGIFEADAVEDQENGITCHHRSSILRLTNVSESSTRHASLGMESGPQTQLAKSTIEYQNQTRTISKFEIDLAPVGNDNQFWFFASVRN